MPSAPIPFPINGISDSFSYEDQPPGTSVEAQNVVSVDPVTGRVRGAQRDGLAKLSTSRLSGNGKVQALATVTYDGRSTTYSNATGNVAGGLTTWDKDLEPLEVVRVDNRGDVFTVDGNALLIKYNNSGVKQWEFPLPVVDSSHVVRTLTLDDFGNVYVGVSEGTGRQVDAWIRSYYPSTDNNLALRWVVKPGGYVEKILLAGGKLYAAVNFPDSGRARIIAYEQIDSAIPVEAQSWQIPYPVNDADLNVNGEVLTAHGPVSNTRSYDPRSPGTTHILDDQRWDPSKLEDWDKRKWCWFSAGAITLQAGSEDIQVGDAITEWRDISGKNQVVLKPDATSATYKAPTYVDSGLGARPAVRFDGADYRLVSEPSLGQTASLDDTQPTVLPGTRGYLLVMVVKPSSDYTTPSALLYQDNEWDPNDDVWDDLFHGNSSYPNTDACLSYPRFDHMLTVNGKPGLSITYTTVQSDSATDSLLSAASFRSLYVGDKVVITNSTIPGSLADGTYYVKEKFGASGKDIKLTTTPGGALYSIGVGDPTCDVTIEDFGQISVNAGYVGAQGVINDNANPTGDYSKAVDGFGRFDNDTGGCIISLLMDNEDCSAANSISQFRVNGVPLAQWAGSPFKTVAGKRSVIGKIVSGDTTEIHNLLNSGAMAGLGCDISEIFVIRRYTNAAGDNVVCTFPNYNANAIGTNPVYDASANSDTEIERIEGYFAWKYGLSHLLDDGAGAADSAPAWGADGGTSEYTHPFGLGTLATGGPPNPNGAGADAWDSVLWTSATPIMAKWNVQRGVRWALTAGGVGYAVAPASDGVVYSVGPKDGATDPTVRAYSDGGGSVTLLETYSNPNTSGQSADYTYANPRVAVDQYDNLWVPSSWASENQPTSVRAFAVSGDGSGRLSRLLGYKLNTGVQPGARAVALDRTERDYSENPNTISYPEAIVLATDDGGASNPSTLHYLDTITAVANAAAPRNIVWVGAAGGDILTFTGGTVASTTGGGSALDQNASFVSAAVAFSKVYFTDGQTYKVFDPKTNTVSDWVSETSGSIPERCRLLSFWRGRMVLARGPDDPFNWHMSALGNPNDWNQFPPDSPLATQAISGNNSEVGGNHDIINAIIPYDRERLIFGGDHTIHMMWGDPMEGGSIALLSDVTGISFGSGYCKDSSGILYFYGSRGGIYAMAPGGGADKISNHPVKISSETIDRRLSEVNLETHYLGLVWDDIEQRLFVYQLPYGQGGTLVNHWVWEKKVNAWWPITFSNANTQPTSLCVLDGDDPDDRTIAIGCEDGYVRYPSRTATTDDGYVIDSYVTIGPFYTSSQKVRVRNPKVTLARDQGGCWMELFSSDTPDVLGDPVSRTYLNPGQNPRSMVGVRGPYVWLRLRNASIGQRWSFESGLVDVYDAGRKVAP